MARPLRIEYPGAVYHVTSRGNARDNIFLEDKDRYRFLEILSDTIERYNWLCHAFCLMDNHYHLLIETVDPTLSKGMRQLNGIYTQFFNRSYQRGGHVFQGRYKAILVQKDSHLLELCRYVTLNPVRAGMVNKPDEWRWSSYIATATSGPVPECLTTGWILRQFDSNRETAQKVYQQFVYTGMKDSSSPWDNLKGQIFLGTEDFIKSVNNKYCLDNKSGEVPRSQRFVNRARLDDLFRGVKNKTDRNLKVKEAHIQHGYNMREIADHLSIHYTTISKIVNN